MMFYKLFLIKLLSMKNINIINWTLQQQKNLPLNPYPGQFHQFHFPFTPPPPSLPMLFLRIIFSSLSTILTLHHHPYPGYHHPYPGQFSPSLPRLVFTILTFTILTQVSFHHPYHPYPYHPYLSINHPYPGQFNLIH